ncbi:hypothetical protein Bbelb_374540 [Branchiostoma belcheri]|nr:hypothetical protein Bbelb_374540 [Branchiostoma belcheri]
MFTIIADWVQKTHKSTLTATGRTQFVFTARNSGVIPSAMVARPVRIRETLDITECASIGDITTKPSCVITGQRFCSLRMLHGRLTTGLARTHAGHRHCRHARTGEDGLGQSLSVTFPQAVPVSDCLLDCAPNPLNSQLFVLKSQTGHRLNNRHSSGKGNNTTFRTYPTCP